MMRAPVVFASLLLAAVGFVATWGVAEAVDTVRPEASCIATANPNAGLYVIEATDNETPTNLLQLFITDTGSGLVYGPHNSGTTFKYVQAASGAVGIRTIGTTMLITGTGPAEVIAVDQAGNVSEPAPCPLD